MPETIRSYRDLRIWQHGIELAKEVYRLTARFPPEETYGLTSQLRRAAVSVPSNIAEGQSRGKAGDFSRFLRISLGSLSEVDTQLVIACELGYLAEAERDKIVEDIASLKKMTYTLINRLAK